MAVGFLELQVRRVPRTECGQGVRGADSSLAIRSHRLSVRGADRASGWFCPIREVGEVPWTWCGMPVVRGADSRTQSECPRGGQVFWVGASPGECPCGGQIKWLVFSNGW